MNAPHGARVRRTLHRADLLRAVADHIHTAGLHNFTLRQAAAAAGTTHKVLLYHFGSAPALVTEAVDLIRAEARARTAGLMADLAADLDQALPGIWAVWRQQPPVLAEVLALAIADPENYGEAGLRATTDLLDAIIAVLPADLDDELRGAAATLLLAVLRGLTIDRTISGDDERVAKAYALFVGLARAALRADDPGGRLRSRRPPGSGAG